MSDYIKTTWVDDVTALSATNLNKIETGVDDAHTEIDTLSNGLNTTNLTVTNLQAQINRNFYDDYLRTLELYYTGHFSGADITGMKGMTFDGFIDTNRVNIGTTTAIVDTVNKNVTCGYTLQYLNATATNGTTVSGFADAYDMTDVANMGDGNDTTYAYLEHTSGSKTASTTHDIGSLKLIKTLKAITGNHGMSNTGQITRFAYSSDNVNWTIVDIQDEIFDGTETWIYTFTTPIWCRYIAIEWKVSTGSSGNTFGVNVYTVAPGEISYTNSILYSTVKTLPSNIISAKLYISVKNTGGTNIVPYISANNGTNYEIMSLISSRTDPLDGTYTEYEYSVNLANQSNNLILKVTLNKSSDNKNTPFIKRYGIHWA